MTEQSNTTSKKDEPWWMDHVRQIVIGPKTSPATPTTQQAPPAPEPQAQPVQEQPVEAQPPQEQPVQGPPCDLRGSTRSLPISSILELLSTNRKSGTLHMTSNEETFTLEILEGDVVHASSDRSTQEQLLGSILVARDKIGTEQLEDFYKRFTPHSGADDEPSEHEELVSREDLKLALEAQVQELFNRLYAAEQGTFWFYEGGSSNVEQRIRLNVTRLLLESARTKDEAERQQPADPAVATDPGVPVDPAVGAEPGAPVDPAVAAIAAARLEPADPLGALDPDGADGPNDTFQEVGPALTEPVDEMEPVGEVEAVDEMEPYEEAEPVDAMEPREAVEAVDEEAPCEAVRLVDEIEPGDELEWIDAADPNDDTDLFDDAGPFDDTVPFEPADPADQADVVP
ncbi:MAG: DUF4388 domain-containing protein [Planctomycetota bacterium]|jgi:hypothetical protein